MVLKLASSFRETLEEVYRRWFAIYIFFDRHEASLKPSLFLHNLIEHPVGISDKYALPLYNSLALAPPGALAILLPIQLRNDLSILGMPAKNTTV